MSQILARDLKAQWDQRAEQGIEPKQARRIWAVEALRPEITEEEDQAARRAVRECIGCFPGAKPSLERVDTVWTDLRAGYVAQAGSSLYSLRQAALTRTVLGNNAALCVEWLVQLYTLPEIAGLLGFHRSRGQGRDLEPDSRRAKPFVRLVLMAIAGYYADCERGLEAHNRLTALDQIRQKSIA